MNYELGIRNNWTKITAVTAAVVFIIWIGVIILRSPLAKETEVVVSEGASVYTIADILEKEGVIDNKFVFVVYTLITGNEKKLQAGRYVFKPGVIMPIIVYSMAKGLVESDDIEVTIPEGSNVWEIDEILASTSLLERGEFTQTAIGLEGKLFPDTYRLKKQMADSKWRIAKDEILEKMLENFESKTGEVFKDLNIQKQKEIIIIASILEKEAKTEEDMQLISGIIKNRLEKGMLLQIDAAVSYGACLHNFKFSILNFKINNCDVAQIGVASEIKIDGPYNTYIRLGLPPGPISNPGLKAIRAALNPADTDYLYYLSTRDGGQIIFSKTAAEHARNRRKYLEI